MSEIDIGIHSSSVLVELNIRCWSAKKRDKQASADMDTNQGCTEEVYEGYKRLFAGNELLKDISKKASKIRAWHTESTLPWSDKGPRLLPTKTFFEYKKELSRQKADWEKLTQQFLSEYTSLVTKLAYSLGRAYDPSEYPTIDELKDKFSFSYSVTPMPTSGDFRIDIGNQAMKELGDHYEQVIQDRVASAMKTAWVRLHKQLEQMSERLADGDAEGNHKTFRDTLVSNAKDLVTSLKHFNINNDPNLEKARLALADTLNDVHDPQDLRDFRPERLKVKNKVDDILDKFKGVGSW